MGRHFTFYSLFLDIQNSFLDILKYFFGYPKLYFRISIIRFMDIQKSAIYKDILKSNYGYPKIELWIPKNQQYLRISLNTLLKIQKIMLNIGYQKMYFVISINRIMDILNSIWFFDIHKSNYGYPKIQLWISKNELWISKNRFLDILK